MKILFTKSLTDGRHYEPAINKYVNPQHLKEFRLADHLSEGSAFQINFCFFFTFIFNLKTFRRKEKDVRKSQKKGYLILLMKEIFLLLFTKGYKVDGLLA